LTLAICVYPHHPRAWPALEPMSSSRAGESCDKGPSIQGIQGIPAAVTQ
jgi:hypothetical protein